MSSKKKSNKINLILGSLILPSLLFPIWYSSFILIILSLATFYNFFIKRKKESLRINLFFPFIIYYTSIILSFIIDLHHNQFNLEFMSRNLIFLVIPMFVYTSNFSKPQILNILENTSILTTIIGLFFIVFWIFGYHKYDNQQEYQKEEWFKNDVTLTKNYLNKNAILNVKIKSGSQLPSFRKVAMLKNNQAESLIVRELVVKNKDIENDVWVLIRNVDGGNCRAWFNITNGEIGKVEGDVRVKSEKLSDGFYRFTHANKLKANSSREWFYISFVSDNGTYSWNKKFKKDVYLQLMSPNLYLDSGENLLKTQNIFKFKITAFSALKNYGHSTYLGLIFLFALVVFVFNSFLNNWIRLIAIIVNVFIIVTLSSKAIIISLFVLLPIYYLYHYFNYKYLFFILFFGIFLAYNSHVKDRFDDLFQTFVNLNEDKDLGDLKDLSTNNRILVYKNYLDLVKSNYIIGHGYKNGLEKVASKFNHGFNSHNQYIQALFNSGITGLFFFILFSISPFISKRKTIKRKYGLEFLIILIIFNFLFESLLDRQWGLIFVSFSYAFYFQFFKPDLKWFQ